MPHAPVTAAGAAHSAGGRAAAGGHPPTGGLSKLQFAVGVQNSLAPVGIHPHLQKVVGLNDVIALGPVHGDA